jgi:hypothetical protein
MKSGVETFRLFHFSSNFSDPENYEKFLSESFKKARNLKQFFRAFPKTSKTPSRKFKNRKICIQKIPRKTNLWKIHFQSKVSHPKVHKT